MDDLQRRFRHLASAVGRQVGTPAPAVIRRRHRRLLRRRLGGAVTVVVALAFGAVGVAPLLHQLVPARPVPAALASDRGEPPTTQPPTTQPAAAPATTATTVTVPPTTRPAPAAPPRAELITVTIYFHKNIQENGFCDPPKAVHRKVRADRAMRAALEQLLAGPTRAERDDGWKSAFSSATAGELRGVRVVDGTAEVDFAGLDGLVLLPEDNECRAGRVLEPLRMTLAQFPGLHSATYTIAGSQQRFADRLGIQLPD